MKAPARTVARAAAGAALAALAGLAGCAKDPTVVLTDVTVDETVPLFGVMRISVARASSPNQRTSSEAVSMFTGQGDAAYPLPFGFPRVIAISMDPSLAGQVILTIEGLEWSLAKTVVASGSTMAEAIAGQRTSAAIMLKGGPLTCGNGVTDPGEGCDDGNRTSGDGCDPACGREGTADGGTDAGTDAEGSDAASDSTDPATDADPDS